MANVKITDLTAYTDAASTDVLPIVDVSNDVTKKISISNLLKTAPLGTAAAPGIAFDGDPNTGIYSPGADQVALSTGGTGRLFVDASGNVQIGSNTSTGARVDITASPDIFSFGSASRRLYAWADSGGVSLLNADSQTGDGFYIDEAGSNIRFWTGSTERMRLTSTGALGLGTSSPGAKLQVSQNTDAGTAISVVSASASTGLTTDYATLFLQNTNTTNNNYNAIGFVNDQGGYSSAIYGIYTSHTSGAQSGALAFSTRNAGTFDERMRITAAGNVGIGANSVSTKLHIVSNGAGGDVWVANGSGQNCLLEMAGNGNTPQTNSALYGQDSSNNVYAGWARGAHPVLFGTNGTERGRWDSSGRFLVGTSTSRTGYQLQVEGNASANGWASFVHNANNTLGGILLLAKSRGTTNGSNTIVQNGDILGRIEFQGADGVDLQSGARIQAEVDGAPGAGDLPSRLVFSTTADGASSPTERLRIDNAGSICALNPSNTAASPQDVDARFFIYNSGTSSGVYIDSRKSDSFVHINQSFGDTANRGAVAFYRNESVKGSISVDNSQVYYNTTSDHRLKENIAPLSDALQKVEQLKPSVFNFIADPNRTVHGFIAHEVQAVVPEAVVGEKDAVDDDGNPIYQGIDQSKLVPLLTAALQEAIAKIETLEAKVAALEAS